MKGFMKRFLTSILVVFTFSSVSYASGYDGQWNATALTSSGKCKDEFSFSLQINAGQITGFVNGKKKSHQLEGEVDDDGNFYINVIGNKDDAFKGVITGNSGGIRLMKM